MSDVSYSVEVVYASRGNLFAGLNGSAMTGKVRDLERQMGGSLARATAGFASGLGNAISGATDTIVNTIGGVGLLAGGALVAGIGKTVKEGLSFAGFVESSVNGLAATLSMLGNVPIDLGLKQANASVEHLRKAAAVLPGEFRDALAAFSAIVPAGLNNGIDIGRLEKLGAQSVAVAASLGVAQNVAGHELAAMLEGRARSSMPLVARLGIHASDWNKQDAKTRFAKVEGLFGKMDPAMQLFQHSWAGLTSTARDNARNVAKTFATPLFESIKSNLDRGLGWFSTHENDVHAFATRWGESLRSAFERAIDGAKHWGPILYDAGQRFGDAIAAGFDRVRPYLERAAQLAERFAKDPNAPHNVATGAMVLGGARLGVGAANMLGPALGAELGPALLGIAPLAIAAAGALHAYTDEQSYFHDSVVRGVDDIRSRIDPTFEHLTAAAKRLEGPAVLLADRMGDVLVTSLEGAAFAIEKGTWLFDQWTGALEKSYAAIKPFLDKVYGPTLNRDSDVISVNRELFAPMSLHATNTTADELARASAMAVKTPPHHNVNVTVNMKVEGSDDPTRVAVKVKDLLERTWKAPSASRSNPNAMFSR